MVGVVLAWTGSAAARYDDKIPANADAKTISHVLNRIGFGARPGDVARVQQMGLTAYIEQQLHPERIPDAAMAERLSSFPTVSMSGDELNEKYFRPANELRRDQQLKQAKAEAKAAQTQNGDDTMMANGAQPEKPRDALTPEQRLAQQGQQSVINELMQAKMLRATMSDRQLEEVLVDFWFNHFNVFVGKGQVRQYLTQYERESIRPHVLGNFREMLGATAHSPAMLFYLDNFQSAAPAGSTVLAGPQNRPGDPRRAQLNARPSARARSAERPQQRSNSHRTTAAARTERELRARADGAAHARR